MTDRARSSSITRTALRRAEWKVVVADSFAEAEAETRAYWRAATPAERSPPDPTLLGNQHPD